MILFTARKRGKELALKLAADLTNLDFQCVATAATAVKLGAFACRRNNIIQRLPASQPRPELALSFGGDGSFIETAGICGPLGIPISGVNLGRIGFLADISKDNMTSMVTEILAGKYQDEKRLMLSVSTSPKPRNAIRSVVNDVVLRGRAGILVRTSIQVGRQHPFFLRGDGVIITTPGGSTAYSMSANGPIITPACDCIGVTPLNPHSLNQRPLVIDASWPIKIKALDKVSVYLDGQEEFILGCGKELTVRAHNQRLIVRHPRGYDYFNTLQEKLFWST